LTLTPKKIEITKVPTKIPISASEVIENIPIPTYSIEQVQGVSDA